MSLKGTGSGRAGKLRMRTKDKRWIPVPYGAGQDTNIRSVNIWNGTEWVCPTWGRLLWADIYTDLGLLANLDSFLFRKPAGFNWTGWEDHVNAPNAHVNNPNYRTHDTSAQQWTIAYNANWERLFYVKPRTDPTYRVVPLRYPLPSEPPNITLDLESADFYYLFNSFYPAVIANTVYLDDGQINTEFGTWSAAEFPYYEYATAYLGLPVLCQGYLIHTDGPVSDNYLHTYQTERRINSVANIDLTMIRQRLQAHFSEQDVNYTGQKHNIQHQQLNRVLVNLRIRPDITYWGELGKADPGGKDFDAVQFSLRAKANIDTHTGTVIVPVYDATGAYTTYPVTVNIPDSTDPDGSVLWSGTAQPLTHSVLVPSYAMGNDAEGNPRRWTNFHVTTGDVQDSSTQIQFEHDFEAPGETSLCFYAEILNPVVWKPYLSEVTINFQVFVSFICLQYADLGKDVPDDLKRADAHP